MDEIEIKKRKLKLLVQQCIIMLDHLIDSARKRGIDSPFAKTMKENLIKRYEEKDKDNTKLLSRNISGYRMALKDLNEMARGSLSKDEQAELKQRIRDELGSDAV